MRRYLKWTGVKRAELFANDLTRKHVTFHDLRGTGITWLAIAGHEPLRIKTWAGHRHFSTTEGYIREAENLRGVVDRRRQEPMRAPRVVSERKPTVATLPLRVRRPALDPAARCESGSLIPEGARVAFGSVLRSRDGGSVE